MGVGSTMEHQLQRLRLAGLFAAITGCFLVYSLIQERLMTLGFGPERERFRHSLFIILVNRLVACAVAAAALGLLGKSLQPAAPAALFAVPSVANVLGSASQYEALKYVSFPLQALAKCAKTVPVMIWGLLLGGRRYDRIDYSCAFTVTSGCALFVLTGSIAAPQLEQSRHAAQRLAAGAATAAGGGAVARNTGPFAVAAAAGTAAAGAGGSWLAYGLLLLGAFLLFDGLTSTTQDKLFAQYDMHSCNQLLWVSVWSAGISLAFLVAGGQLWPAMSFVLRHPSALVYILLLSAVSTAVQLFIFYTIQQYGALHFALIMTIRQFLSIVLSCLVFNHELSPSQWVGTALVIGGLLARGMHRGGLDRTSALAKAKGGSGAAVNGSGASPKLRHAGSGSSKALLLPLSTIPVIRQASDGLMCGDAVAAAAAAKKDDAMAIAVDVQAGALASAQQDGGGSASAHVRSPSPVGSGGGGPSVATRRKALEMG
ncbi:hypothetical protein ABPG75_012250 [Micractinium tetrahymenae]